MSFLTKKILAAFILPIPLALLLLMIGLAILFFYKNKRSGKILLLCGTLILLIFSTPFIPGALVHYLESQYPPMNNIPQRISNIVVLGAGNGGYAESPPDDRLSAASLSRLIEGIRIQKMIPNSILILSGGRVFGSPPDSDAMNNVASMLGVDPKRIRIENGSRDTFEEAVNLRKIIGQQPFILVTSAYHMPRAMQLFQYQGMHPFAAPTELLLGKKRYTIKQYFPNATNLMYSDIAIHELLGSLWSELQGK